MRYIFLCLLFATPALRGEHASGGGFRPLLASRDEHPRNEKEARLDVEFVAEKVQRAGFTRVVSELMPYFCQLGALLKNERLLRLARIANESEGKTSPELLMEANALIAESLKGMELSSKEFWINGENRAEGKAVNLKAGKFNGRVAVAPWERHTNLGFEVTLSVRAREFLTDAELEVWKKKSKALDRDPEAPISIKGYLNSFSTEYGSTSFSLRVDNAEIAKALEPLGKLMGVAPFGARYEKKRFHLEFQRATKKEGPALDPAPKAECKDF